MGEEEVSAEKADSVTPEDDHILIRVLQGLLRSFAEEESVKQSGQFSSPLKSCEMEKLAMHM